MPQEKILLVDDQPENIGVLYQLLEQYEYELLIATDAESALEIANNNPPNLILLDIMMPDLNGIECCQKLKAHPNTQHIPVIFMSALTETEYKIEGFQVGGVDYITKPFQQEEVLARVQSHLTIARLQNSLKQQNQQLDAFAHTVAHDLKNTMHEISGGLTMLEITMPPDHESSAEMREGLEIARNASFKASNIIESLLLLAGITHQNELVLEPINMHYVIDNVKKRMRLQLKEADAQLTVPEQWPLAVGYAPWIEEIWVNYISNALKYGGTPPYIELGAEVYNQQSNTPQVRFWVQDNGLGLSAEEQKNVFTPFTRLHKEHSDGHGLGLTIVENIVHKLNGSVSVQSVKQQGSRFYFSLPYCPQGTEEPTLRTQYEVVKKLR